LEITDMAVNELAGWVMEAGLSTRAESELMADF
jgi:hypothetical protein